MLLLWRRWKEAVAEHLKRRFCIISRNGGGGAQPLSHVWLFETPWTVTCRAPLSLEFSRLEHWSGEWVAIPFSKGSSQPGEWTCISCTAGRFLTAEPLEKPLWVVMHPFKNAICWLVFDYSHTYCNASRLIQLTDFNN